MSSQVCLTETDSHRAVPLDELEAFLQCKLHGRIRDFRLSADDRGLVLQGHTDTYYAKQLAQSAVMSVTDQPIAANEIEVD